MNNESSWGKLLTQLPDIELFLMKDRLKIIPVLQYQKRPVGKDYYNVKYEIEELKEHNGNFGIAVGYGHDFRGYSLAVIDIDGISIKNNDGNIDYDLKKRSAEYIYQCLVKHFKNPIIIQSQSGGKHIYVFNECDEHIKAHDISKSLSFPEDCEIKELQGKRLSTSIEIFSYYTSKQCILPGSQFYNQNTNEIREYKLISENNKFDKLDKIDNIHIKVKDSLLEEGFTYNPPTVTTKTSFNETANEELITLKDNDISFIATSLAPYFKELITLKNDSYLALGGFLSKFVTKETTEKIVTQLLQLTDDIYPPHITAALENYKRDVTKTGLPHLISNIKEAIPDVDKNKLDGVIFKINRIINKNYVYRFIINSISSMESQFLELNYGANKIEGYKQKLIIEKDQSTRYAYSNIGWICDFIPTKIYRRYNILDKNDSDILHFEFYSSGTPFTQYVESNDMNYIENHFRRRVGMVLKPNRFGGLINEIISEFKRLGAIENKIEVPVDGVFVHNDTLYRKTDNEPVEIKKPSKENVTKALEIWQKLFAIYKGDKSKLSHILRWGIGSPFSYTFKTTQINLPMMFLYGPSQTSKTTLAEISLSLYTKITSENSVGGGAVDTPYRLGKCLSTSGYGCVVNEPAGIVKEAALIDILKNSVETKYCREKGTESGGHIKIPSYRNLIFTSNIVMPDDDSLIKRTDFIEFDKRDRMTAEDREEFINTFNHLNWEVSDFNLLRHLGDYFVYCVSEDLSLLKLRKDDFINKLLDMAFEFTQFPKINEIYMTYDDNLLTISDSDSNVSDAFRSLILADYNRNHNIRAPVNDMNGEFSYDNSFQNSMIHIIRSNAIDYLMFSVDKEGNENIVVRPSIKHHLNHQYGFDITGKSLAGYFDKKYTKYSINGKSVRGFRFSVDEFFDILT